MYEKFWSRYAGREWRFIIDPPLSGAANMERDIELLENCTQPILRLYDWEHPTLSLGRGQHDDWIDRELCRARGVEIVRRPTGGRALLHIPSEITYAVVLPDIGSTSIKEAFTSIAAMLAGALKQLGLPVATASEGEIPGGHSHPSCLAVTAPGEVTAMGRKLVGSAQVRHAGGLLQHGSIMRRFRPELLAEIIPGAVPEIDLYELGFAELKPEQLAEAWKEMLKRLPQS